MAELYAQVILPLPLHDSFTYRVPGNMHTEIGPGQRVIVQFGRKKLYAALVLEVLDAIDENIVPKDIIQVLDDKPLVLPVNLSLWKWIAEYYCCTLGDVFRAALPAGLKLESKSVLVYAGNESNVNISTKEEIILRQLKNQNTLLDDLQKSLGDKFSYRALNSLYEKKIIRVEEKVSLKYKPKTEPFIRLHSDINSEVEFNNRLIELKRAKKQKALLIHFYEKAGPFDKIGNVSISKKELFAGTDFTASQLNELIRKEFLYLFYKQVSRIENSKADQVNIHMLNRHQEEAYIRIEKLFEKHQTVLIHGVTASGKTEIYIHLIDEMIKSGKQALYLVPEIALTTQIIKRLKMVFGERVGIYHSRLNSQERVEVWNKVLQFHSEPEKGYNVILGARSSLFLPFSRLGLVIVDEEHENSFKQFDPAPRYHARDTAVILAIQSQAKVLLGSATPSIESFFNSMKGKYGIVTLTKRHHDVELPEIVVADIKRAYKRKEMRSFLSPELYSLIVNALDNNEQVILFQNRRGYSPFVECFTCGWIPRCLNCDVSLTYHKYKKRLSCHYCGYSRSLNDNCDDCGSSEVKTRGFGTEKIETELKSLFRNARISRMDLDTTRSKDAFEKIVNNLENQKTDILVGTQMVTKGLDFEYVSIVGILNADNLINFPDFRAHERAYQLISQVSGRAGRKHGRGKVVIQTSQPEHPLIETICSQDYNQSIKTQLQERNLFHYPPYFRLIKIVIKHKNEDTLEKAATRLGKELRRNGSIIVLGPESPLVSRIQLWHHKEIWLKVDRRFNPAPIKSFILRAIDFVKHLPSNSSCQFNVDVDPA